MKPALLLLASAATSAVVGGILFATLASSSSPSDATPTAEVHALRNQVDELNRELNALRGRVESFQSATASSNGSATRLAVEVPKAATAADDSAPAIQVPTLERELILAVIEQREKDKERERKDKQRQQAREGVESGVKRAAERVGLDTNTTASVTKLYLDNLAREEEIRRAYPVLGQNDPNTEKSKLEIDAARSSLETAVASLIPVDKAQDWNNQTRWLRRAGDMLYNADQAASGAFNMFGNMAGGRGGPVGMDFGGGQGGGTGGRGGNRNTGSGQGQSGAAASAAPGVPVQTVKETKQP